MSKADGQLRQSQVITTYGPGALVDLPKHAAIMGGLDTWAKGLDEIVEPRLTQVLNRVTGVPNSRLHAPPPAPSEPWATAKGIGAWRFPEWFVVQEVVRQDRDRSRRLVHRKALDGGRFEGLEVVPTRFVRACPRGHVDDLNWARYVHGPDDNCRRQLWLDEQGTTGDLGELRVRCECGKSRSLREATQLGENPLGTCRGARPWLGLNTEEDCNQPSRLLIRTASNAWFPQVFSVLSLPDRGGAVDSAVEELWGTLQAVDSIETFKTFKLIPKVAERLSGLSDDEVLEAIYRMKGSGSGERNVKEVELDALLGAPEGFGDDTPIDPNFHARGLPEDAWRQSPISDGIAAVVQLHRLREVLALVGFTRLEPAMRDIHGEYDTDVERADIALDPQWFPAIENRGEGVFVQLHSDAVDEWRAREGVRQRADDLVAGYLAWCKDRRAKPAFPGVEYILLHTLAHLLIQTLAMRCGYPATSIRERIYVEGGRYGLLLYTGTPDAEGTLGGLVQQGRYIEDHLVDALRLGQLCSNDPICAQHSPRTSLEERWLHGAACHGCALIAETSCEMRNDYLDRALVVPVLGRDDAAFFPAPT